MAPRLSPAIWKALLARGTGGDGSLQGRIREMLVSAILDGTLPPGTPVPSSREMAEHLGVARNTVVLAYQQLRDEGYLEARQRSGYFVNGDMLAGRLLPLPPSPAGKPMDWERRLWLRPTAQRSITKPADWQKHPYPFLYGQFDPTLFPTADWREGHIKNAGGVRGPHPPLGRQLRQFRHLRECRGRIALWPAPAGRFRHRAAAAGRRKYLARAHDRWKQLERTPLRSTRRPLGFARHHAGWQYLQVQS